MHSKIAPPTKSLPFVLAALLALGTTACGGPSAPPQEATAPAADAATAEQAAADQATADQAAADQAAADLAAREAELKAKEVEIELRERELAAQQAAAAKSPAKAPTPAKQASVPKAPAAAPAPAAAAPPPPPVTVAAGTPVPVKLVSSYSTKTTALGAPVNAELASDLVVDGRRVAKAGAPISGTVTEVTSGSKKIGAVPALKIDFTQLVVADGTTLPVAIRINQKGQSEKGRDTAKIAGGTAAGAIIGHQIDDDKGKVIGGVIGGVAGAIGAQKTGTEVELPAGTVLSASVRTAFTYSGR
ncbi:MAG: glycine zipper 2TM domain-containing protein [Steroidobacteraceae bacterium]|nr:glycine zipper 2TM domain-containing protein [Steroidobacteraceae bacterium]